MIPSSDWLAAFPIQPATEAVDALRDAWTKLAERRRTDFNPETKEAALTKGLKIYTENVTARERGLLGMWSAEDVIGVIDKETGKLTKERRTDIVYGWNDADQSMQLVFEFKRMGRQKRYRDHYLREQGLGRFITDIHSRGQPVAAMVGVLLDPEPDVVPPIIKAFDDTDLTTTLRLRPTSTGQMITMPSTLFSDACFDTEHERDPEHGIIRVSHFFWAFGYPTSTQKTKKL